MPGAAAVVEQAETGWFGAVGPHLDVTVAARFRPADGREWSSESARYRSAPYGRVMSSRLWPPGSSK